jgi:hypothetical protein
MGDVDVDVDVVSPGDRAPLQWAVVVQHCFGLLCDFFA